MRESKRARETEKMREREKERTRARERLVTNVAAATLLVFQRWREQRRFEHAQTE